MIHHLLMNSNSLLMQLQCEFLFFSMLFSEIFFLKAVLSWLHLLER